MFTKHSDLKGIIWSNVICFLFALKMNDAYQTLTRKIQKNTSERQTQNCGIPGFFKFFSWPSVHALAIIRFISGSPVSYIFCMIFIRPLLGSSLPSSTSSSVNVVFFVSATRFSVTVKCDHFFSENIDESCALEKSHFTLFGCRQGGFTYFLWPFSHK